MWSFGFWVLRFGVWGLGFGGSVVILFVAEGVFRGFFRV